jgi:hypothetical protein
MVTNATNCKDCIKADVCSKKDEFAFAFKEWAAYKRDAKAYTPRTVNRKGRIVCKII